MLPSIAYAKSLCKSGSLLFVLAVQTGLLFSTGCAGPAVRRGGEPFFVVMPPNPEPLTETRAEEDGWLLDPAEVADIQSENEWATIQAELVADAFSVEVEAALPDRVPPEPDPLTRGGGEDAYILRAGDIVNLQVFREPEISGSFQLSPAGVIRHPLLGVVALSGITVSAAEEHIRHRLATEYLVNPRVILKAETMPSMQVLLMGEVRRPGAVSIPYGGRMTLMEAIATAGGFTDSASPNRIRVVRTVDGKNVTLRVRVGDILSGRGKQRDVVLEPNDIVTIPEVRF